VDPAELPIGVFDSGTGGLAVLKAILTIDAFDNRTGQPLPSGDGQPDLAGQSFIYLADQANMPYGNYPNVGRQRFLEDLII
jgi:glutamate racemase